MTEEQIKASEGVFQAATFINIIFPDVVLTSTLVLMDEALKEDNPDEKKITKIINQLSVIINKEWIPTY